MAEPTTTDSRPSIADELQIRYEQLQREGNYKEAIPLAEQACAMRENAQGKYANEVSLCLSNLGSLYFEQADYTTAEALFKRVLSIREKTLGPKHPDVATTLHDLAVLYQGRGEHNRARNLAERALTIRENALPPEHPDIATSLHGLAVLHRERGDYSTAEQYFQQAMTIREKGSDLERDALASSLNGLATLYKEQGKYTEAESLFRRSLDIREVELGPDHPKTATSLHNLAHLYFEQGQYEAAKHLYERALFINEAALGIGHPEVASNLDNLAGLHKDMGDYHQARLLFERALSIREQALGPAHPKVANSLNNLSLLYMQQGEYDRAEPLLERALSIREKVFGADHLYVATSLNNLAGLYLDQGEYEKAEILIKRAIRINETALGTRHPNVAINLNNLAGVYKERRRFTEARRLYERSLSIFDDTFGFTNLFTASSAANLALVLSEQEEYRSAALLYKKALSALEEVLGPDHPNVAACQNNLAMLYHAQGSNEQAESLLVDSLRAREHVLGTNHADVAKSLNNLARVRISLGEHDSALELYRRSLHIEDLNLSRTLVVADEMRRLAYASKILASTQVPLSLHLQVAPNHQPTATLALTTLLRRKSRIRDLVTQSSASLRRTLPDTHQHILEDLSNARARYSAAANRGPRNGTAEDYRLELSRLEREQDILWAQLRQISPQAQAIAKPIVIADLQARLPGDAALVEFVKYKAIFEAAPSSGLSKARYAAYIVFPHRFDWVDLGPAALIDGQVQSFREAIMHKADTGPSARALYGSTMEPVTERLGNISHLFIAPDADLNLIPFDALVDEHDNYLIERFHLRYLTSGRDLLREWALEPVADGPVVVVANPTGADLPGTEHEAILLTSMLDDTVVIQHDDATETRLRSHERPRILHLATHGTFGAGRLGHTLLDAWSDDDVSRSGGSVFDGLPPTQLDNPMLYSWFDLAMPETLSKDRSDDEVSDLDDGKLTAYEVSGWDLRGTQLVTLSACDTAQGMYQRGEGILGLRRAFTVAGAQTQVMSFWKVSDTSTTKLMTSYYRRLLDGEGRSEAMRNTQLELLRSPETRHPRDWASFVVVGDWAPLLNTPRRPHSPGPPPIEPFRTCQASTASPSTSFHPLVTLAFLSLVMLRRRRLPAERS